MRIISYQSVDGVAFGERPEGVGARLGPPEEESVNHLGEQELAFQGATYRFEKGGGLVEVSVDVPVIELGTESISFAELPAYLRAHDDAVFETVGFIVSPRFGIALDPEFPSWLTVFASSRLSSWQDG